MACVELSAFSMLRRGLGKSISGCECGAVADVLRPRMAGWAPTVGARARMMLRRRWGDGASFSMCAE